MSNAYYNHTPGLPQPITRGDATQLQNEFARVANGFNELPPPTRLFTNSAGYVLDVGGANAFVLQGVPGVTSYLDGMEVLFKAANTVSGPTTINVNGIGVRAVNRTSGTALQAGDIAAGQIVSLRYSASADGFQFFASSAGAVAGAAAAAAASATQSAGYATQALAYSLDAKAYRDAAAAQAASVSGVVTQAQGLVNQAQTYSLESKAYRDQAAVYAGGGVTGVNGVNGPGPITVPFSAIPGRPATYPAFVLRDSPAQSTFGTDGINEFVRCTYGASANFTLPNSAVDGQRVRVLFSNRLANKVWAPGVGGGTLKFRGVDVSPGQWVNFDRPEDIDAIHEFVYIGPLGCWYY